MAESALAASSELVNNGKANSNAVVGAVDNLFFYEDEIFKIDKKGKSKFGIVIETSETSYSDEEDDYDEMPRKGEVRVAWFPENREELQSELSVS